MGEVLARQTRRPEFGSLELMPKLDPVAYPPVILVPTGRWGMETGCLDAHNLVYTEASKTALSKQCGR